VQVRQQATCIYPMRMHSLKWKTLQRMNHDD
jgi:hypothetical protein